MAGISHTDPPSPTSDVTELLRAWSGGDKEALKKLMPLVYGELHRKALVQMRRERADHTLQPTALVHEAYLKLVDQRGIQWQSRGHFFAVAARAMRQILVDHARARAADKRGGLETRVSLDDAGVSTGPSTLDILALDIALDRLAGLDERQARLVELRVFSGLTIEESAEVLGCSHATVSRDWKHAQAWLRREMSGGISQRS